MKLKKYTSGFTLVEMVISISIILIITAVIMLSQRNFSETVELINVSQRVATVIREAQVKGLAVEILDDDYPLAGRGVYFDGSVNYIYFSDTNENYKYDVGEEISSHFLRPGFTFGEVLCGSSSCDELNVVYRRPETQAYFYDETGLFYDDTVSIPVVSDQGRVQTVKVLRTGQITVIEE
ncbi:MAG: prepilin-type N-terminal cleavage/methylation domain-containing protein [Candidatus Pacebacteria bacterium]|nr:prepilin-type N-terminal cleavage/methylation domain-containing protein [Candidatus Paceibacterota bacterium]